MRDVADHIQWKIKKGFPISGEIGRHCDAVAVVVALLARLFPISGEIGRHWGGIRRPGGERRRRFQSQER